MVNKYIVADLSDGTTPIQVLITAAEGFLLRPGIGRRDNLSVQFQCTGALAKQAGTGSESHPYLWFGADYQASAPPVWYSVTRVSKKFFSLPRSIVSLIHGNGLREP